METGFGDGGGASPSMSSLAQRHLGSASAAFICWRAAGLPRSSHREVGAAAYVHVRCKLEMSWDGS